MNTPPYEELLANILTETDPNELRGLITLMLNYYNGQTLKRLAVMASFLPHANYGMAYNEETGNWE